MAPSISESHDPGRCTPCRGTGTVISALGGTPKPVTCPWCEDAQAARKPADGQRLSR